MTFLPARALLCLATEHDRVRQGSTQPVVPAALRWFSRGALVAEKRLLEGANRAATTTLSALARGLQGQHTGRLQRYLLWSSISLLSLALLVWWQMP